MLVTTTRTGAFDSWKTCIIFIAVLAPFLIYFSTLRSIIGIWNSSETFVHGYIILPLSLWMIWKRRHSLPMESAAPFRPGMLLLLACGFGWLLAELAAVQVVQQYAFVAMLPLVVLTLLGPAVFRAMAFPLLFLLLAVPFGESLIDPLINVTADFTVAALQATGIPVLRNGTQFEIPSGSWSVVEACSGVRYLIASVTLGCLYAYLTYRSRVRQAVFILISIVVPIIANGLRAYMIVMIGHLSGMELAVGVDHLIYGWLFFGLVMFIMLWLGSFWREDLDQPATHPGMHVPRAAVAQVSPTSFLIAAVGTIACLAIWPLYSLYIERANYNPAPASLSEFKSRWQEAAPFTDWKPGFTPANAELFRLYTRDALNVGIFVGFYRNQHDGSKLISSSNLYVERKSRTWQKTSASTHVVTLADRTFTVREATLRGTSGPMLVWHWYWIDGRFTANDYAGKLLQAKEEFLLRGDDGASVLVFAPFAANPNEARTAMQQFLADNLASLEATLAGNQQSSHGQTR